MNLSENLNAAVYAQNVSKSYQGGQVKALKSIGLTVPKGSSYGLIGPNGAGKSTFIKSLLGLVSLDEGEILINGVNSTQSFSRKNLSYLPEKFSFHSFYTVLGVLKFYSQMRGISSDRLEDEANRVIRLLNIESLAHKKMRHLSKGQVQRVGLASLLIGESELLILDEPFSGLDPIGIKDLKEILKELREKGKTLLICSHILLELEALCDEIGVLCQGQLVSQGNLKKLIGKESLEDYFYSMINQHKR